MDFAQVWNFALELLAPLWASLAAFDYYHYWKELVGDARLIGLLNLMVLVYVITVERRRAAQQDVAASYNDLDTIYQRLLEQRVNRPWLKDATLFSSATGISQPEASASYRAHAYAVWTFLETIKDRLDCEKRDAIRKKNQRVWQPIIRSEGGHYLDDLWYFCTVDKCFNDDFIQFVRAGGFVGVFDKGSADEIATARFASEAAQRLKWGGPPTVAAAA